MSSTVEIDNGIEATFSHIPLELLQAELRRRQQDAVEPTAKPECGTKGVQSEYDVSLHVFALILILALSCIACVFPIVARRFPRLPIPHHFLFLSRHFGTGVLIATAFVHLLPTAFTSLSDPCLPDFWTSGYTAMPGLIAMISVLVVVGIEMFFASQGAGHIHGSEYDQAPMIDGHGGGDRYDLEPNGHINGKVGRPSRPRGLSDTDMRLQDYSEDMGMRELATLPEQEEAGWNEANGHSKAPAQDQESDDSDVEDLDLDLDELDPNINTADDADLLASSDPSRPRPRRRASHSSTNQGRPTHERNRSNFSTISTTGTTSPQLARRLLLQCALLEAGILFHSVFIGMALSVSRGPAFVVLLIAIAFHQTFEGLALGARIAAIVPLLPARSVRPWLMALAYGTTTPAGQALGLAIHTLYDPQSEVGLILVGCMNAISSGLLLFAGLVELLAEDFLSEGSYKTLTGKRRLEACVCVVMGSLLMALIGAWA